MGVDVSIGGLGVAGATLAYLLASKGFKVRAYDVAKGYHKACGDAVTVRPQTLEIARQTGSIVTAIRRFVIAVNGNVVHDFELSPPPWIIVDKARMVSRLREMASELGAEIIHGSWVRGREPIWVDARGPYSRSAKNAIFLYRVYTTSRWSGDTVMLDFNVEERGVYWIFPVDTDGKMVNIGAGFEGVNSAVEVERRLKKYHKRVVGEPLETIDRRGALMQLFNDVTLYKDGSFRVGEAAGLLLRTGGEGNRPAILSAAALARSLSDAGVEDSTRISSLYRRRILGLVDEVLVSRILLALVRGSSIRVASDLLASLPREFWIRFVRAEVKSHYLARLLISNYGLGVGVVRALLSYLSSRGHRLGS